MPVIHSWIEKRRVKREREKKRTRRKTRREKKKSLCKDTHGTDSVATNDVGTEEE